MSCCSEQPLPDGPLIGVENMRDYPGRCARLLLASVTLIAVGAEETDVVRPARPDRSGPRVAYVGNVRSHSDLANTSVMVVGLAGGKAVNASEGLASARAPAWSLGGERLAFEAVGDGQCDVFVCRPDGSGRRNVTASPDAWNGNPCFVDTARIAFLTGPDRTTVWLVDLGTGDAKQLSTSPLFHKGPVASPDQSTLAVVGSAKLAGPGDIFLVPVGGGATVNLTRAPALYSEPAFSPDGRTIVFSFDGREIGGASRGVASLPVTGGEPVLLARDGYALGRLCFSPDGARIAYTSATTYHSTWVRMMRRDGSDSSALSSARAHIIAWPSFTPDGKGLVYQGVYAARYTIRFLDLATGKIRTISPSGGTGVTPVCSPR